jgi:IclR family transcriptional regulator, KDG regulon repressor
MLRSHAARNPADHPESSDSRSDPTLSTLDRGLHILEVLAGDEAKNGLTLTELGRTIGMHRSTLFRFLATLRARGYIDRDAVTDRYRVGARVLTIAGSFLDNLDIRHVARPALQSLCDRTQELVHLAILDHGDVVTIERIEGTHPVSLQTGIGARRPTYCTASGKAILAYLPLIEANALLPAEMPSFTARTITSRKQMLDYLGEVRRLGYAIDDEERIEGVRCVAAPVFGYDGGLVGAISVAAPVQRASFDRLEQFGQDVKLTADSISRQLGYMGPSLGIATTADASAVGTIMGS